MSEVERKERIDRIPGIKFVRWAEGYRNSYSRVVLKCDVDGNEWETTINSLVNGGTRCPKCANNIKRSQDDVESLINSIGGLSFEKWSNTYVNSKSRLVVRCDKHQYSWESSVIAVTSGKGCKKCAGTYKPSADERIASITKSGSIGFINWVSGYKNKDSRVNVVCTRCAHIWDASVHNLSRGKGCPKCANQIPKYESERISQLSNLEGCSFVEWDGPYSNKHSYAKMRCHKCDCCWSATVASLVNAGSRCPSCTIRGFDQTKPAQVYCLRSKCGSYVKIGISNEYTRRISNLDKATPFEFDLIEIWNFADGSKALKVETDVHRSFIRAGLTGFDGCTEWLLFDPHIAPYVSQKCYELS